MTEHMLRDSHVAYGLNYIALRYFNVAGADPQGSLRTIDAARHASDQGRLPDSPWPARKNGSFRHRLQHARWHVSA